MRIHIREGKGGKDRGVPLSPTLHEKLRQHYRRLARKPAVWLFPGGRYHTSDDPISDRVVWHACRWAAERAGIRKPIHPHTLRHYTVHLQERSAHRSQKAEELLQSATISVDSILCQTHVCLNLEPAPRPIIGSDAWMPRPLDYCHLHLQNEKETGFKKNMSRSVASRRGPAQFHVTYAFGKLAEFVGALAKGAHVAVEGELRSHEYQREVALGTQTTSIPQRVWEIRVDSVLKLDRAVKDASNDNSHEEVPR